MLMPVIDAELALRLMPLPRLLTITFRPVPVRLPTVTFETLLSDTPALAVALPLPSPLAPAAFVPTIFPRICVPLAPALRLMPFAVLAAITLPLPAVVPPMTVLGPDTETPVLTFGIAAAAAALSPMMLPVIVVPVAPEVTLMPCDPLPEIAFRSISVP